MSSKLLFVFLLLLLNAFFASSEMAFVSININKVKVRASEKDKKAEKILSVLSDSTTFLSSIQVGVTLSGFLASALAAEAFSEPLVTLILKFNDNLNAEFIKVVSVFLITFLLSYVTILFGELVPKKIALAYPEQVANLMIKPISMFATIFKPFVLMLAFSTNLILKMFKIDPKKLEESATEEEIRLLATVSSESGHIDEVEREMIDNIFAFDDMTVDEIMTHRTEVLAINVDWSFEEIVDYVSNERFTRYPVFEENIDNIIGTIHLRDLLIYIAKRKAFAITDILRKPYFVPTAKNTDDLFNEFKVNKNHIAVVIDEYGGTAGIVTMEDLIEEIMGDISDEYDEDDNDGILQIKEDVWFVDGDAELYDLEDSLDIEFPENIDTVSGFIISELKRLPEPSDINSFDKAVIYKGYRFVIIKAEEKIVTKAKIFKLKESEKEDESDE